MRHCAGEPQQPSLSVPSRPPQTGLLLPRRSMISALHCFAAQPLGCPGAPHIPSCTRQPQQPRPNETASTSPPLAPHNQPSHPRHPHPRQLGRLAYRRLLRPRRAPRPPTCPARHAPARKRTRPRVLPPSSLPPTAQPPQSPASGSHLAADPCVLNPCARPTASIPVPTLRPRSGSSAFGGQPHAPPTALLRAPQTVKQCAGPHGQPAPAGPLAPRGAPRRPAAIGGAACPPRWRLVTNAGQCRG